MASSKFPTKRDHFVYVLHALNYPFYVGHGHAGRCSDRPVFIDRLVRLHPNRSYNKWELHGKVVADLWAAKVLVYFDEISSGQTKEEAAADEMKLLGELLQEGFLMSNDVGNAKVPLEHQEVVAAVLARNKQWDFLTHNKPVNRYMRPTCW